MNIKNFSRFNIFDFFILPSSNPLFLKKFSLKLN